MEGKKKTMTITTTTRRRNKSMCNGVQSDCEEQGSGQNLKLGRKSSLIFTVSLELFNM